MRSVIGLNPTLYTGSKGIVYKIKHRCTLGHSVMDLKSKCTQVLLGIVYKNAGVLSA